LAKSPAPLHLGQLGKRLRQECGDWVSSSRYGGAGSLQKLIESQPDLSLRLGTGGAWLFDPVRHKGPTTTPKPVARQTAGGASRQAEQGMPRPVAAKATPARAAPAAAPAAATGPTGTRMPEAAPQATAPVSALPLAGPVPDVSPNPPEPAPTTAEAQRDALLQAIRAALAASPVPLHLGGLGTQLRRALGPWVGESRYGGAGSLQKLLAGQRDLAVEIGPGGGWLFDPARHERPSAQGTDQPEVRGPLPPPGTMLPGAIPADGGAEAGASQSGDTAAWPGPASPPHAAPLPTTLQRLIAALPGNLPALLDLGGQALGLALDSIAALLPLAPPREAQETKRLTPEARQRVREALAADPDAIALGLSEAGAEAVLECLERGGFGWQADAGPRLRRSFHAALLQLLAWGGTPPEPAEKAALRAWIGLAEAAPPPGPELVDKGLADEPHGGPGQVEAAQPSPGAAAPLHQPPLAFPEIAPGGEPYPNMQPPAGREAPGMDPPAETTAPPASP
jgi:hypothetical protein